MIRIFCLVVGCAAAALFFFSLGYQVGVRREKQRHVTMHPNLAEAWKVADFIQQRAAGSSDPELVATAKGLSVQLRMLAEIAANEAVGKRIERTYH